MDPKLAMLKKRVEDLIEAHSHEEKLRIYADLQMLLSDLSQETEDYLKKIKNITDYF